MSETLYTINPSVNSGFITTGSATESGGTIAGLKFNSAGTWVMKPLKAFIGGTWVTKPLKFNSGGTWV